MDSWLSGYLSVGDLESIVFGSIQWCVCRFDLAALCGCHTLNVCLFVINDG